MKKRYNNGKCDTVDVNVDTIAVTNTNERA